MQIRSVSLTRSIDGFFLLCDAVTMASATAQRRTQAERTAATRAALLEATLECLVSRGFGGTTTTEVAHRAGVSPGALLHHFPAKADLLCAAVAHLIEVRRAGVPQGLGELQPAPGHRGGGAAPRPARFSRPALLVPR